MSAPEKIQGKILDQGPYVDVQPGGSQNKNKIVMNKLTRLIERTARLRSRVRNPKRTR